MLRRYDQAVTHCERTLFLNPAHALARENLRKVTSWLQAHQVGNR